MHISYRLLAILFAMLLTAATEAATPACREYGERAGWIGITPIAVAPNFQDSGRIIVNGDAVYVSGNVFSPWAGRLHVIDVSDGAAPVVVDSLNIFTADVEMRDNHLYVAAVGDGFKIVSLADPLHPELVGHLDYLDLGFGPNCVSLMGSFAYLSYDGPTGVVVDISDPSQPQVVGPFDIPWGIWALSCAGSTGYVGSNGDLVVLDCSDPLHPIQTEVISVPEELTEMTVLGNLGAAYGTSTIYLFDLTDPAHPSLQSTFIPQHGDQDQRFAVSGNLLLWITTFAAEIWDLSNPAQPQFVDVIDAVDGARLRHWTRQDLHPRCCSILRAARRDGLQLEKPGIVGRDGAAVRRFRQLQLRFRRRPTLDRQRDDALGAGRPGNRARHSARNPADGSVWPPDRR
jgi:hypothetical protein